MKILVLGSSQGAEVSADKPAHRPHARGSSAITSLDKAGQMSKTPWLQVLALALAAFFVVGSISNIFAPGPIYEEYLKWGYPRWFHFVTGSLELTTAVLLARASTRLSGAALGCTVMLGALATVILHGEYGHAVPPLVVAILTIVAGWITWRERFQARHD